VVAAIALVMLLPGISASSPAGLKSAPLVATECPGPLYLLNGSRPGTPAITPRNSCTPSFTAQDVLDFTRNHGFFNKGITPVGPLTVIEVWFVTVRDGHGRVQVDDLNLPGDAVVCYAELRGPVLFTSLPADSRQRTATVYEVFDARTGNLLARGGG
jgi:hypothetical protein